MSAVCGDCHSASFTKAELAKGDDNGASEPTANSRLRSASSRDSTRTGSCRRLREARCRSPTCSASAPRRAPIERKLYDMYLEHRMRAFQGTFHDSPDYALWRGWSGLVRNREEIEAMAAELRRAAQAH